MIREKSIHNGPLMKKVSSHLSLLAIVFFLLNSIVSNGQDYTSYFTGDTSDVTPSTTPGIVLMGGATEHDSAMVWFLERCGGGDVVVIRASGSDGYNNYLFSQLGVSVNSVETIVFNNANASSDPYVENQIRDAEGIWIAGGDQWDYVSYWKNTAIEDALNDHINLKGNPIGGTSAGMAILGNAYFSAQNGTVTSSTATSDPMNPAIALGYNDFISTPWLSKVITDTHYDNPDRRGRHLTFMARLFNDYGFEPRGIASEEYTAVCIDTTGKAYVFGDYPTYEDYAYFLLTNCVEPNEPETVTQSLPLTWDRNNAAVKTYKVPGTPTGQYWIDLNDWETGSGGSWEDWYCESGTFTAQPGAVPPGCGLDIVETTESAINLYPNPTTNRIWLEIDREIEYIIHSLDGRAAASGTTSGKINVNHLLPGSYILEISGQKLRFIKIDR